MPIKLNTASGGGVILQGANTASDKTITIPADDGTMIYANSSGNVGIGTSSPAAKLDVNGVSISLKVAANNGGIQLVSSENSTNTGYVAFFNGTSRVGYLGYGDTTNGLTFASDSATNIPIRFVTNATERARIDSSGNLLVGISEVTNGARFTIVGNSTTLGTSELASPKGTNNSHIHYGTFGDWYIRPASSSGKVYVLNYQAESDERLKQDIEAIHYGLQEILQLQPRKFCWKNGDGSEVNGFIAQEVESVIPAIVSEGQWKSIDYQGITAVLVKAIQELKAEVDSLRAQVEAK